MPATPQTPGVLTTLAEHCQLVACRGGHPIKTRTLSANTGSSRSTTRNGTPTALASTAANPATRPADVNVTGRSLPPPSRRINHP